MTPEQWLQAGNIPTYYTRSPSRQQRWAEMDDAARLQEATYEIQKLQEAGEFNPEQSLQGVYALPEAQSVGAPIVQNDPCAGLTGAALNRCQSIQAAGGMGTGMGTGAPSLMNY